MAYDRYDARRGSEDDRWRSSDRFEGRDRSREERSGWSGGEHRNRGGDDRGFFERAGEQIASWFGDDDDDRHESRRPEHRHSGGSQPPFGWGGDPRREDRDQRDQDRSGWLGRGSDRHEPGARERHTYGRGGDDDRHGRSPSWHSSDDDDSSSYRSEMSGGRTEGHQGRFRGAPSGYRPMTGDYGRSEQMFAASGYGRGSDIGEPHSERDYGRSDSNFGNDPYRRTSFAGSSAESNHADRHYHEWRRRQMEELDRDYEDYRREHQSKFESDFGGWREKRQSKRQMLGSVREHMEVVGSDDEHVGTVDRVVGDRLILTKSDPEAGGLHHSLSCHDIERIEDDRIRLSSTAEQAKKNWRAEERERAEFEPKDQGASGPHMLDRSFSGTYR